MKVVILIPTYNEKENITNTIENLEKELERAKGHQVDILIFDSQSPDGTAKIVNKLTEKYDNLHLVEEKEKSDRPHLLVKP